MLENGTFKLDEYALQGVEVEKSNPTNKTTMEDYMDFYTFANDQFGNDLDKVVNYIKESISRKQKKLISPWDSQQEIVAFKKKVVEDAITNNDVIDVNINYQFSGEGLKVHNEIITRGIEYNYELVQPKKL